MTAERVRPWNTAELDKLCRHRDTSVLDNNLRHDILTCGELSQACYDACESEPSSFFRCWNVHARAPVKIEDKQIRQRIVADSAPDHGEPYKNSSAHRFEVTEEFFANAGYFSLARSEPNGIIQRLTLRALRDMALEAGRKMWVGFAAEYFHEESQEWDIVICWRGTSHAEEWTVNLLGDVLAYWNPEPTFFEKIFFGELWRAPRVHYGFQQLYCRGYRSSAAPQLGRPSGPDVRNHISAGMTPGQNGRHMNGLRHDSPALRTPAAVAQKSLHINAPNPVPGGEETIEPPRKQVRRLMQKLIRDHRSGKKRIKSITVTGHSLGGALATLCAYDISEQLATQQELDSAFVQCGQLLTVAFAAKRVPERYEDASAQLDECVRDCLAKAHALPDAPASKGMAPASDAADAAVEAVKKLRSLLRAAGFLRWQEERTANLLRLMRTAKDALQSDDAEEPVSGAAEQIGNAARLASGLPRQAAHEADSRLHKLDWQTAVEATVAHAAAAVSLALVLAQLAGPAPHSNGGAPQIPQPAHQDGARRPPRPEAHRPMTCPASWLGSAGLATGMSRSSEVQDGAGPAAPVQRRPVANASTHVSQLSINSPPPPSPLLAAYLEGSSAASAIQQATTPLHQPPEGLVASDGLRRQQAACGEPNVAAARSGAVLERGSISADGSLAESTELQSLGTAGSGMSSQASGTAARRLSYVSKASGTHRRSKTERELAKPEPLIAREHSLSAVPYGARRGVDLHSDGDDAPVHAVAVRAASNASGSNGTSPNSNTPLMLPEDAQAAHDVVDTSDNGQGGCGTEVANGQAAHVRIDAVWKAPVIRAVTFAAPHVGNDAFVRKLDKEVDILRVVNKWDMVPHVPGILHFIVAIGELWLRMTPTYRWWRFSRLVLILPWWAYDDTKANLILDSGRNNLMQPGKRQTLLAPGPAHSLEGYLFLLCAQYRRWQVPRAKNDLKFDVLMFIAILFACLAYAGYAVALARAVSGHLHLSMPGTLLLTALALLYCGAAAALATGLVLGAIIGPHWCHMLVKAVLPTLGDNTAVVTVSNIFGIGIGAAVGAAASLLLGGFFVGILILYLLESLCIGVRWLFVHARPAFKWLKGRVAKGKSLETIKEGFDNANTAFLKPSELFKTKTGFQRHTAIQTIREVARVTGRWPGLMNKTSSLLLPTLGIKPAWWDLRNTEQWREATSGIGPAGGLLIGDLVDLCDPEDLEFTSANTGAAAPSLAKAFIATDPYAGSDSGVLVKVRDTTILRTLDEQSPIRRVRRRAFGSQTHKLITRDGHIWWPYKGLRTAKQEEDDATNPNPPNENGSAGVASRCYTCRCSASEAPPADVENGVRHDAGQKTCNCHKEQCSHASARAGLCTPVPRICEETPLLGLWRRRPDGCFRTVAEW